MKLYRYESMVTSDYFNPVRVYLDEYEVEKETPKGYWINVCGRRWVPKIGNRVFARTAPETALADFKIRKKKQIGILKAKLDYAREALEKAEKIK